MAGFPDGIPWVLQAAGPVLTLDSGPLQARISQATGHLQLAGPDLSGTRYSGRAAGFIKVAIEHPGRTSTVEYRQA